MTPEYSKEEQKFKEDFERFKSFIGEKELSGEKNLLNLTITLRDLFVTVAILIPFTITVFSFSSSFQSFKKSTGLEIKQLCSSIEELKIDIKHKEERIKDLEKQVYLLSNTKK